MVQRLCDKYNKAETTLIERIETANLLTFFDTIGSKLKYPIMVDGFRRTVVKM